MRLGSLALLVAVLASSQPSPSPRRASIVGVLDAMVRYLAPKNCGICYVTVNGKVPRDEFIQLISDVGPPVRPLPATGVPEDEFGRASVIDLFRARTHTRDRAEVSASISADLGHGLMAFESCTYHLTRTSRGWEVMQEETRCLVL
jgi:hypothetical protein